MVRLVANRFDQARRTTEQMPRIGKATTLEGFFREKQTKVDRSRLRTIKAELISMNIIDFEHES